MKIRVTALSVAACLLAAPALAADLTVSTLAGPWDPTISGNFDYGTHDESVAPTYYAVNPGDDISITYLSGLGTAFGGTPTVDANGYVDGVFGSGTGLSGIGSSGKPFPSNQFTGSTDPDVWLLELLGDFVDSSGKVIGNAFAVGDGPFAISAPSGAVALQLGVNDDIYSDNVGAFDVSVTGSTVAGGVPEPEIWTILMAGFFGIGAALRAAARKSGAALSA